MEKFKDISTLNEYMTEARKTAIWNKRQAIDPVSYCTHGIAGESGEFADKVKKVIRDDLAYDDPRIREDLALELGDVLWYVTNLAAELGYSLQDIAEMNITKLRDRQARGVLRDGNASGDHR